MSLIKKIIAREILDSRGSPTLEADVIIREGLVRAAVPSGASTGKHEALEFRDGGKRYNGKGVLKAVNNINKIITRKIKGMDCTKQREIDELMIELDGTENKSKLGANAVLAVSKAVCRAGALSKGIPLYRYISRLSGTKVEMPVPFMNIINGGRHAQNNLSFQEYMIVPKGKTFSDSLRVGVETYYSLKNIIIKKYGKGNANVGDEGGFAPQLKRVEEPLRLITDAIDEIGYAGKVKIALDVAASEFHSKKGYFVDNNYLGVKKLISLYDNLIKKYPIVSIEDPFEQESFEDFAIFTRKSKAQVVGDDLLVTNIKRLHEAIKLKAGNALLLKLNQIGTVTEAIDAANLAFKSKWNVMVSHRSGETEDNFISDLAVGLGCKQIKAGAPCRGERVAKYNQLLRIEEEVK